MREYGFGSGISGTVDLGSYTQTWITCSGTSGASSLTATGTFSANDIVFIHQTRGTGAGAGEFNTVASYTTGTITLVSPLENTYTDSGASQAQVAVVKQASSVTGSYTVGAWNGDVGGMFVMMCNGTFSGTVNATAKGFRGGAQIRTSTYGNTGEGSVAASSQGSNGNANGNGAGASYRGTTGAHGAGGSGGGNGAVGTAGLASGGAAGTPGAAAGQADLTTGIFLGGGGASGAKDQPGGEGGYWVGKAGGTGGGIIIIYAKSFSSTAQLTSSGANGTSSTYDLQFDAAGGGGAGGTVLIKSQTATIGTSKITASGGAGGTMNGSGANGGAGAVGRIRIESCSLSGTTSPSASTSTGGHSYCGSLSAIL